MKVIQAHIEDIKAVRAITATAPFPPKAFGKNPREVFDKAVEMFRILREICNHLAISGVELPPTPREVLPRDLFNSTVKVIQHLVTLKRRIGAADRAIPAKANLRISPSHVYGEAVKINSELELIRQSFAEVERAKVHPSR